MVRYLTLVLVIVLVGCGTHKNTYQFKDNKRFDSITYQSERVIYPSLKDTVFIQSPCDSLGKLKPFKQSFTTSQGKITFEGKNNRITANIDLKGTSTTSVVSSNVSKASATDISDTNKTVRVFDWRLLIALVCSVILNVYLIYNRFNNKA